LRDLTAGHNGGIYNGPKFSRIWVKDSRYGVPFLGSSAMLMADLSRLPLLSKKEAFSSRLSHLEIKEGTTLISCSGSIGRMVYSRSDMEGMWTSQHVMKIVPDQQKILPGYLYAYLSSDIGTLLVTSNTYGAIIQHIEPHHISSLPIPRFEESFENKVHEYIVKAASLRVRAAQVIRGQTQRFDELVSGFEIKCESPYINVVRSSTIQSRFDAQYHDPMVAEIRERIISRSHSSIGNFCSRIFLPGIFKRIQAEDSRFGAPYFTGASLFWLEPIPKSILSKSTSLFDQVLLEKGTILVQAFGQDGGLTGRSVWVGNHLDGCTTTHMLVRLNAKDPELSGYLFAFLQSEAGHKQIACLTYGGSIPHLDENGIASVVIPLMPDDEMRQISKTVIQALDDRDEALSLELEARKLVEKAIEEAAT